MTPKEKVREFKVSHSRQKLSNTGHAGILGLKIRGTDAENVCPRAHGSLCGESIIHTDGAAVRVG